MAHYVIDYETSLERNTEVYWSYLMVDIYDVPDHLKGKELDKFILLRLEEKTPQMYFRNIKIRD